MTKELEKISEEDNQDQQTTLRWVAGKTRNGKTIVIKPYNNGLYRIELEQGGRLPKELKGRFTSVVSGQDAVDIYLSRTSYITREQVENRKNAKNTN